jgi:hypothetical protein
MAFCCSRTTVLADSKKTDHLINGLVSKGFVRDGGAGWEGGGWCRYIQSRAVSNAACPGDKTSITAPGARWVQLQWRAVKEKETVSVCYHVTGLIRDSRREQHEQDLCSSIRVRAYRRGPEGEHPEWMAEHRSSRSYPTPPAVMTGTQLQVVTRFSCCTWHCRWDCKAFPFQGYWWDDASRTAFVPEPECGPAELENQIVSMEEAGALSLAAQ